MSLSGPQSFQGAHHIHMINPVFHTTTPAPTLTSSGSPSACSASDLSLVDTHHANSAENPRSVSWTERESYAQFMFPQKRGYPLWKPKPQGGRLPGIYKQKGVHIGDIGILNEFGGFSYLFNTCHPANHELNLGRVPENFEQLLDIDYDDIEESEEFEPGSHIASQPSSIRKVKIAGRCHIPSVHEDFGAGQSFTTSISEGALLVLPEGGRRCDHMQYTNFYRYAAKCAQSWYNHVNGPLARGAHNGALYLITGFDKARAWGAVSFINANPGSVHLEYVPKPPEHGGQWPRYLFCKCDFASHSSDSDASGSQSGSVFLRGFKIAVRHNPFLKSPEVCSKVTYISDMDADDLLPKHKVADSSLTAHDLSISHMSTPWTALEDNKYEYPVRYLVDNPSDMINRWILDNYDEVDIAITHDNDWASVLENDVSPSVR
ncbi:hypothetical protein GYMLUDRAFT_778847 [Collybiopsis luxurians FD-317 M1]|uniref:Uncharacterized protein n=1 Tax=Collybiopsis luxurians FD-317 M1 TaxID=944289 RepID=A0A0D0CEW0_9AGAR|nr:hypothetical protein GYMLUDRAFT_778847 [Collybiopsis luxurians FD-317 M1]